MRKLLAIALAFALTAPATAALAPGKKAPMIVAEGAMAGGDFHLDLKQQLKKGPVVLYFFPAAFTGGCNAEAAAFAQSLDDFTKAGATVIGMTGGNVDRLKEFSSVHCAGKFAVAQATPATVKAFDVALPNASGKTAGWTSRTSFVIAPNGKILFAHTDMSPANHIKLTLEAVQKYQASHKG